MCTNDHSPVIGMTMLASAELQDHLLTVTNDLERLRALLDDSHEKLQEGFFGLLQMLPDQQSALTQVANAVKALQFQDMASQLIVHTSQRLHHCADELARIALAGDGDGDAMVERAPLRANPVTQSEMDSGFIELF